MFVSVTMFASTMTITGSKIEPMPWVNTPHVHRYMHALMRLTWLRFQMVHSRKSLSLLMIAAS